VDSLFPEPDDVVQSIQVHPSRIYPKFDMEGAMDCTKLFGFRSPRLTLDGARIPFSCR
jgi:hypothetical protein